MAAGENGILLKTFTAAADLSSYQYHFVKLASATTVTYADDAGAAIGILQNKPESGESASVMMIGISCMKVGTTGVAAVMDKIKTEGTYGYGTTSATNLDNYNAIALETGVSGDVISVLLTPCSTLAHS
jgi:hypothetical protein